MEYYIILNNYAPIVRLIFLLLHKVKLDYLLYLQLNMVLFYLTHILMSLMHILNVLLDYFYMLLKYYRNQLNSILYNNQDDQ